MRLQLLFGLVCLPFVCAAVQEEPEPSFAKIKTPADIEDILDRIEKLAETGEKGGARLAADIIGKGVGTRGDLFAAAYATLKRSKFSGLLPRCLCKLTTCALAPCYARCTIQTETPSQLFDCTSCVGDCIPLFMRCLFGLDG